MNGQPSRMAQNPAPEPAELTPMTHVIRAWFFWAGLVVLLTLTVLLLIAEVFHYRQVLAGWFLSAANGAMAHTMNRLAIRKGDYFVVFSMAGAFLRLVVILGIVGLARHFCREPLHQFLTALFIGYFVLMIREIQFLLDYAALEPSNHSAKEPASLFPRTPGAAEPHSRAAHRRP